MPVPSVWVATRRPKRIFIGVAGGLRGAEELVRDDAHQRAKDDGLTPDQITFWEEHGEPDAGRKFTRAAMHVSAADRADWKLTYDLALYPVHQQPKPRRAKLQPAGV